MNTDLQKASTWKRISAWLFDTILMVSVVVLFGYVLSGILNFDGYYGDLTTAYEKYETQFGIDFEISQEAYLAMDEAQRTAYDEAYNRAHEALVADEGAMQSYGMVINLALLITSISILLGYLVMELLIPILLKNGQTLGKKIFSIAVMRTDSIRLTPVQLFVRTVLGKYAVGTMIPVYVILLLLLNTMGVIGLAIVAGLAIAQVICLIAGGEGRAIHDRLAGTVVVDISSQRIFKDSDDLIAYTKKVHAEQAKHREY